MTVSTCVAAAYYYENVTSYNYLFIKLSKWFPSSFHFYNDGIHDDEVLRELGGSISMHKNPPPPRGGGGNLPLFCTIRRTAYESSDNRIHSNAGKLLHMPKINNVHFGKRKFGKPCTVRTVEYEYLFMWENKVYEENSLHKFNVHVLKKATK